jgi:hypothetical protein
MVSLFAYAGTVTNGYGLAPIRVYTPVLVQHPRSGAGLGALGLQGDEAVRLGETCI